ncbi:M20/M25/M40 family metallo-hydrolase [Nocardia sp. NPDC058519]|uniref:M20/M25/M40 family metallo-hydrolase n=1 Tax=Nocardia sp. NPDC058519 TaxID=3346535 RepID=UPI0036490EFE
MTPTTRTPSASNDFTDHEVPAEAAVRLRRDVEQLVGLDRRTIGRGERESAHYLADRLAEIGAKDITTTTFRTQSSWAPAHLAYLAVGAELALLSHPAARVAGAAVAAAYELEVSGRLNVVKRLLPARRGTSVWARIPAEGTPRRTLVLAAHHDAAHMGMVWHPHAVAGSRLLAKSTGRALPSHAMPLAALAAAAMPSRKVRAAAGVIMATSAALMIQSMRSPTAPGANDNASGVAAVLEVARRLVLDPLPDTTVVIVFPGGEEAANGGIRDWLHKTRRHLDPANTLVVNLDAVGSHGPLGVARREGLTNRSHAGAVDRAMQAAAELNIPIDEIAIPNATDAAVMTVAGLPTVSLLSVENGWISNLHQPSDTVDNVDWTTVHNAARLTGHIAQTWATEHGRTRIGGRPVHGV